MQKTARRTKRKTRNSILAVLALSCLAACDSRTVGEFKAERTNKAYLEAMDDYTAGRLDAAVKGFEKVLRADPSNTSARFQLACLQQDSRHDNLGAFCNYHEYLQQAPDSDKAKMAKERLAICERALAEELAKKMNLIGDSAIAEEIEHSRKELADMKKKTDEVAAKLKESVEGASKLKSENERLRKLLASLGGETSGNPEKADIVSSGKDLLDAEEASAPTIAALDEAKALNALAEADDDDVGAASSLLPTQAADAKEKKKALEDAAKKAKAEREAKKAAIPDTYVVQEGDTLYKIALRFYGRTSAWKMIREANKETITTDGRVRTGQTLKLPK